MINEIVYLLIGFLLGLVVYFFFKISNLTKQLNNLQNNHNNLQNNHSNLTSIVSEMIMKHNLFCIDSTQNINAVINSHNELVMLHNKLCVFIANGGEKQGRLPGDEWKDGNRFGGYFSDN